MGEQTKAIVWLESKGLIRLHGINREVTREMFKAYSDRRLGALRHTSKTLERDFRILAEFINFTGQPPWRWNGELFESWCSQLGQVRKLSVASQRVYQTAIKQFMAYLVENTKFRNQVLQEFGLPLIQFCTADNCIPHLGDRELSNIRRSFTHEELQRFFITHDTAIREAQTWGAKGLHPLRRDRVLYFTLYVGGLRISEALGLDLRHFWSNPRYPELGQHGYMAVWGKGSKGSGKRLRTIPIDNVLLPNHLEWYRASVRPVFLARADANEQAVFLSQRGTRLALQTIESRFAAMRDAAGLDPRLTLHSFRHASVTHGLLTRSLEAMRLKHGHAFGATTEGYNSPPDIWVADELHRYVDDRLRAVQDNHEDGGAKPRGSGPGSRPVL
jgi:site-specific recombinase XerD